jgi:hypothetical protein
MPAPTKPATLYAWDSSGTHIVVPTSGHQSNGWANNEVPGSGETNGLQQNWWQELAWLDYQVSAMIAAQWIWQLPGLTIVTSGADAGQLFPNTSSDFSVVLGASANYLGANIRIDSLPVGAIITACSVVNAATASGITGMANYSLALNVLSTSGAVTALASITSVVATSRTTTVLTSSDLPYTLATGDSLYMNFTSGTGSGQGATLYKIGLQVTPL